jgi:hypothetical protein
MLAAIASGHADLAELFFLFAAVLATIATVVTVVRGAVEGALVPAAVALIGWAFFVL